jgi:hypothetical protein
VSSFLLVVKSPPFSVENTQIRLGPIVDKVKKELDLDFMIDKAAAAKYDRSIKLK